MAKQQQFNLLLKETEQHIIKHLSSSNTLRKDSLKPVAALRYDHIDHWPEEAKRDFVLNVWQMTKNLILPINVANLKYNSMYCALKNITLNKLLLT